MDYPFYNVSDLIRIPELLSLHPDNKSERWKSKKVDSIDELLLTKDDAFFPVPNTFPLSDQIDVRILNAFFPYPLQFLMSKRNVQRKFGRGFPYPEMNLISIKNALVYPGFSYRWMENVGTFALSDVYDREGKLLIESGIDENGITLRPERRKKLMEEAPFIKGNFIFFGLILQHYGHFWVDSLARMWPAVQFPETINELTPMVDPGYKLDAGPNSKLYNPDHFIGHSYQSLGFDAKTSHIIDAPVLVEQLIVPSPAVSRIEPQKAFIHPIQNKVWDRISGIQNPTPYRRIYLSRKNFSKDGSQRPLGNEEDVEKVFMNFGFEIIYPEELSFKEQLKIYRDTEILAGTIGTNMFNSVFTAAKRVIILAPHSYTRLTPILLSGLKGRKVILFNSHCSTIKSDSANSWFVDTRQLSRRLQKFL